MIRRPPRSTLFPTRRSSDLLAARGVQFRVARLKELAREALLRAKLAHLPASALDYSSVDDAVRGEGVSPTRSEEHTSELQSQSNLVCRLLLEKKNSHPH